MSTNRKRLRRGRQRNRKSLQFESLETRQLLTTIDLATLTTAQGSTIFGAETGDFSGASVSSAGDVNGDGFDDLLLGAQYADGASNAQSGAGDSYVIFGGPTPHTSIDLSALGPPVSVSMAPTAVTGADSLPVMTS